VHFGSASKSDIRRLQRTVRTAELQLQIVVQTKHILVINGLFRPSKFTINIRYSLQPYFVVSEGYVVH